VKLLLWLILLFFCWPLALVALVLYPLVWLLLLPFPLWGSLWKVRSSWFGQWSPCLPDCFGRSESGLSPAHGELNHHYRDTQHQEDV